MQEVQLVLEIEVQVEQFKEQEEHTRVFGL